MAAEESIEFEWTVKNYQDSADCTKSPEIELCGQVYYLELHPRADYLELIQKNRGSMNARPVRLTITVCLTPGKGTKSTSVWKPGRKSKYFDVPPLSDVLNAGNVLRVNVKMEGVKRAPDGVAGELVVKKRKRKGDSTTTTSSAPEPKRQRPLADDSAFLCTLCLENMRNAVFKPCNHMGCCFECASQLEHKRCPFCNNDFTEVEQVFLP
jgi:hypothetical protein